ncbi:MAG TPA: cobalamin-independent methionine synthase II family protein [Dehalococcoidia bacterium]|nr:cobalamin-independent methionine synthase II family protein [Dehalococcoidia bacterium]
MVTALHADHIGSMLRPPELIEARRQQRAGKIDAERLREIEDESILKALELQKAAGIEIFTDGEYRRETFLDPLTQGMEGLTRQPVPTDARGRLWQGPHAEHANAMAEEFDTFLATVVGGKLRRTGRLTGGEAAYMAQHSPGPWKMTMPGPMLRASAMYRPGVSQGYESAAEVALDMASLMADEVRDLAKDGVSYLQLDSLLYANPVPAEALAASIEADNIVLDAAKAAGIATVGLHMCRGNNRSSWLSEGSYEPCAEEAFNRLHADRFLLEYDTERAGGFEPLRFMPKDKMVVLGLISSKEPQLETMDALQRRIDEAAKFVAAENLGVSPQCGFASSLLGNLLSWEDQRRKLELVVETARKIWG